MSMASPTRPSRRTATRRQVVVESSDTEEPSFTKEDVSEEFTPAPKRTTARTSIRRRTAGVAATPQPTTTTRRSRVSESVEPSQIYSPPESVVAPSEPPSPARRASPRKLARGGRQSIRRTRKAEDVNKTDQIKAHMPLPTPQPSQSPEPTIMEDTIMEDTEMTDAPTENMSPEKAKPASPAVKLERRAQKPLADITEVAVNEQAPISQPLTQVQKVNTAVTVMEKPMDIVIRKRAAGLTTVKEEGGPRQRMVITYLILNNFKSYAGRQEVGPFHTSFSSVVGPNGSGKSNVIDSLLFVFGFRASKMRQGKLSALIHNSAGFPDLDFCEVEVHFQEVIDLEAGGTEVVPDSTLIISRKAFKNNSSSYYINGRTSNFTTVTTLLKDKGVDLDHKRFLILQGEVESIAQMKPKAANEHDDGLLEYLEDIIGTSKYKAPIDESVTQTEELNEVCREKSGRVQHVEKEKNALEEKKNKALAFINDENELVLRQAALCQVYMAESSDTAEVAQEATTKLEAALVEELSRHQGSAAGIKQLEKQYKAGQKEYDSIEADAQAALKEIAKLDKDAVKYEEKRKFLVNKRKKLEKTVETSSFSASEATIQIKKSNDDIQRISVEIEELERDMEAEEHELTKIRGSLKGKTQGLSDEIAKKQKSLEPWNAKINDCHSAIAVAQSELEILIERDSAGAVAAADVQAKITAFEEKKDAKSEEVSRLRAELKELTKQLSSIDADSQGFVKKEESVRVKISDARQKADEARASLSATQSQGNVLTGLMRLKESGRIDGFHGRLGNLGTIDQKYDVAISTACPALDNLVVDSVEVGQQCIEYLRKNNLGRANFICLDKLPQRDLSPIEGPEGVPRLFDLVKSREERFRAAFFSIMQNTLVAKNMDQANRIAYGAQRWRVVTLEGQLIDKSGTMSGGGTRVAKGAMSSKLASTVTRDQVSKLEVDRDALEQSLQEIQREQKDLETSRRDINKRIPQLETQQQKLNLEISSLDKNIADAQRRLSELESEQRSTKGGKTRRAALEKTILSQEAEVENLRNGMASIEEELKALQDKIMEIGGVKLRSQKAKVDDLKEQIETSTNEMTATEVNKTKAEKLKIKHDKAHKDASKELDGSAGDLEKVEADLRQHNTDTAGSRQTAEEAQEAMEERKEQLTELKRELDEKSAEMNENRAVEIEMRNNLEENQKSLNEALRRVRHWEEKLSKLALHDVAELTGEKAPPKAPEEGEEEESQLQEPSEGTAIPMYSRDELQDMHKDTLKAEIADLEKKTSNVSVDLSVLSEYRRRVEEHATRFADLNSAVSTRDSAKKRLDELRRLRLEGFMEGFSLISLKLKEMYQMITMGGNAELELVDSLDPFSEGILFSVMPPKKSWKNISNLSGGEKTLSSLALVFALHHYRPTPLYVMDEIDAALDFRNVSIVASYIKERTKNAQFIVISLRNNMFELASRLVGVYKVNHMTKSVTIENRDYLTASA